MYTYYYENDCPANGDRCSRTMIYSLSAADSSPNDIYWFLIVPLFNAYTAATTTAACDDDDERNVFHFYIILLHYYIILLYAWVYIIVYYDDVVADAHYTKRENTSYTDPKIILCTLKVGILYKMCTVKSSYRPPLSPTPPYYSMCVYINIIA